MRTIKLDVNSLEKAKEQIESENARKYDREHKKRSILSRPLREFES